MDNSEFARLLAETADLMEIAGDDGFRIRSYRNAAAAITGTPVRVEEILRDPERKVTEIPGVGKGIAAILGEIAARGSFERRDELLVKYPPAALEMLKIQGLGPKSLAVLFAHFDLRTIDDLERLCQEQKLRDLPRMGAKLEEKVLRSIAQYRKSAGRFLLSFGAATAATLTAYLSEKAGVRRVTAAGSYRRGRETIGDLDLLATGEGAREALDALAGHPSVTEVLGKGENKASVKFGPEGLQVDLRALPEESFGAALQYFTGSKEHNVALRARAQRMGLTLNEYGLMRVEDNVRVAGATEEGIYAALGLAWISPELRENQGEIEAAATGTLPKLIEVGDVRGDVHMHTTETDGRATLEEMAGAARRMGYEYVAITDHSKALAMANGLDEKRVVAFARRVRKIEQEKLGIRVFSGLECDIRKDGTMDIEEDALAELDLVIASVHSHFSLEPAAMTDRILRAMESPSVRILGHPTGRVLLHRDAYAYAFERVVAEAVRKGVLIEINASPERLDLHAPLIRAAKAMGARFAISTDAHDPKHLANIRFGVQMARRGWLEAGDVVNTRGVEEFAKAIRKS